MHPCTKRWFLRRSRETVNHRSLSPGRLLPPEHSVCQPWVAVIWPQTPAPSKQSSTMTWTIWKYPKIKEYDAILLNNLVGSVFSDPDVMNGLIQFVREGGGLAAIHGSTFASPTFRNMESCWASWSASRLCQVQTGLRSKSSVPSAECQTATHRDPDAQLQDPPLSPVAF